MGELTPPKPPPAPLSRSRTLKLTSRSFLIMNALGLVLMGLLLAFGQGYLRRFLEDLNVQLPTFTRLVLGVPGGLYLVVCLLMTVALLLKELVLRNRLATLLIEIAVAVLVGIFLLVYLVAILLVMGRLPSAN